MYKYPPLEEGTLICRYKRFFVDIRKRDGRVITVHNANTGSMKSLLREGNPVLYSTSTNTKRKLPYSLEFINVNGEWIVSNTIAVNRIVESALKSGSIPALYSGGIQKMNNSAHKGTIRREFPYKDSRIDFLIEGEGDKPCLVEVKSVTYFNETTSFFPDAVTTRGRKHLYTLLDAVNDGYRAVMLYVCMADRSYFACAKEIDPEYCSAMQEVTSKGVEKMAVHACLDRDTGTVGIKCGTIDFTNS